VTRAKIMIVDDSPLVLEAIGQTLRSAGYEVIARSIAIGTGAAILREKPALVLLDVSMPLLSGPEISGSLRASQAGAGTLIVLFSDRPSTELESLVRQCGAAGYVSKAARAEELLAEIGRHLAGRSGSRPGRERRRGRLDEVLVAGQPDTVRWARALLREHATVRGTDSGTEALRLIHSSEPLGAVMLGTGLLDLTAHMAWTHATRTDERWRDRIVVVEEPGHPGADGLPGMLRWSARDSESVLLSWLGFGAR
jgi:CheY-like chemotaxis protein